MSTAPLHFLTLQTESRPVMATGALPHPSWIIWPCAILSVGLGYCAIYSRRRRASNESTTSRSNGSPNGIFGESDSGDDVVLCETPHPTWSPGQKQPPPEGLDGGHVEVNPRACKSCYSLVISAVTPRPIALVSTQAADGTVNLAPFSYFNAMGHDPPTLAFSVCRKGDRGKKDTLLNIEASGEYVVSIMSDWFIEAANHTCGGFPPEVDEMEAAGLTPAKSTIVAPPRVAESAVNMECKVRHTYDIVNHKGDCTATVVFGEVVMFHVFPHLLNEAGAGEGKPTVNLKGYKPMARLGGSSYARLGSSFDLLRPSV